MNNFSDPVAASRYPLRENNRPYVCSPPDSRGMKQWRNAISRAKCIPVKFSTCSSLLLFQRSRIFLSAILFLKSSIYTMYPSIVRKNLTQISYAIINSINDRIIKKKKSIFDNLVAIFLLRKSRIVLQREYRSRNCICGSTPLN